MNHVRNKKSKIFADRLKASRISNVMNKPLILLLKFYKKFISPILEQLFGKACRFTPSCSEYTIGALERFGTSKGLYLGLKRWLRCNPFGKSGYDAVPKIFSF